MEMLLAGDDPVLKTLRAQFAQATIKKRMFSGVGFVTDFAVPQDAELAQANALFFLADVTADLNGAIGAGFHIQVKGGRLKLLEGFTYDDLWPPLMTYKISYKYPPAVITAYPEWTPETRLLDYIRTLWA